MIPTLTKSLGLLAFIMTLTSCVSNSKAALEEHDRNGAETWLCEHIAEQYRKDREANPTLCDGYDEHGGFREAN